MNGIWREEGDKREGEGLDKSGGGGGQLFKVIITVSFAAALFNST